MIKENKSEQCGQRILTEWRKGQDEFGEGSRRTNEDPGTK